MKKEEALPKLAASREVLLQAIASLSAEEMTQVQVEGVWTIKDILGHIASWDETLLAPLRSYADGGPYAVTVIADYLAWNDVQAARKRDIPLNVVLEQLTAIREELIALANKLSAEQWEQKVPFSWGGKGTVAESLLGLWAHEQHHTRTIQQWCGGRS